MRMASKHVEDEKSLMKSKKMGFHGSLEIGNGYDNPYGCVEAFGSQHTSKVQT